MKLKYRIKRWKVMLRRSKPKELELNEVQQKAYDITIKLINDKESELVIDPETGRKGIKNKEVWLKIGDNKINIINGVYHYDIAIDDRIRDNIVEKFNSKLSRKFNVIDNHSTSRVNKSLDNIMSNIDNPKK